MLQKQPLQHKLHHRSRCAVAEAWYQRFTKVWLATSPPSKFKPTTLHLFEVRHARPSPFDAPGPKRIVASIISAGTAHVDRRYHASLVHAMCAVPSHQGSLWRTATFADGKIVLRDLSCLGRNVSREICFERIDSVSKKQKLVRRTWSNLPMARIRMKSAASRTPHSWLRFRGMEYQSGNPENTSDTQR